MSSGTSSDGFDDFRHAVQSAGMLKRPVDVQPDDSCYGLNDDATLTRFWTARKHRIHDALSQFKDASQIRLTNHVSRLYDEVDVAVFEETRSLYPQWCGRLDRKGQPICTFESARLDAETWAAYRESCAKITLPEATDQRHQRLSKEVLRSFVVFDYLTRFVMPLCSALERRKEEHGFISKILILVDISGMTLGQVWNLRSYLQGFISVLSTSFPEILDKVFIIGASGVFPSIWNLIKRWADPETVSKFAILSSSEVLSTLREHIDDANIPRKYGGSFDQEQGMHRAPESSISELLEWTSEHPSKSLPDGPLKWTIDAEGNTAVTAVGSVEGDLRVEHVATLRKC